MRGRPWLGLVALGVLLAAGLLGCASAAPQAAPGVDQKVVARFIVQDLADATPAATLPVLGGVSASPSVPQPATGVPPELVGAWYNGTVSSIDFYAPDTGSWTNGGGTGTSYAFRPDGTYDFGWLTSSTLYGCSMQVMVWKTGQMSVDASQQRIDLVPSEAKIHSVDDCSETGNYDRDIERDPETLYWGWSQDEYGNLYLMLRYPDSDWSAFYPFSGS